MTAPALSVEFLSSLSPDTVLGVAVSGGSDSMGLLHLLLEADISVSVATVNHHLRDEAGAEARAVAEYCGKHGIRHETLHWRWDGQGNLQDQARRARYRLLSHWATRIGAIDVALGHTADDNIETFFMGLSRGAGLDGLSGMRPTFVSGNVRFHRPLLQTRRAGLRAMLVKAGTTWSDDRSNDDLVYHRIQVRQSMSALEAAGVSADHILMSLVNLQATRRDVNADLVSALNGNFQLVQGDLCFELAWLESLSPESRRRLLKSALQFVSGQEYPPRGAKMMRVLADLRQKTVLHGCLMTSDATVFRVGREFSAVADIKVPTTEIWDGRWSVDGAHSTSTEIRALGEAGLTQCDDCWRETGLPRSSLLASPSVWDGNTLLAAPLAGLVNNWHLTLRQHDREYREFVLSH